MEDKYKQIAAGIKAKFPNLNYEKFMELMQHSSLLSIPKRGFFIKSGQYKRQIAFVLQGFFRGFYRRDQANITFQFCDEYKLMAAYSCILSNKASNVSYQALEDSQLIIFDYDLLKKLSLSDIEVAQSIIVIMEELLRQTIERIAEFAILNPEQRYLELLHDNPSYIQRAPQQDLASYIGITPVSFSRLKSRVKSV